MIHRSSQRIESAASVVLRAAGVAAAAAIAACSPISAAAGPPPGVTIDPAAAAALSAAKRDASVSVLPTMVVGTPMPQVGEVVALLLERSGMNHLDLAAEAFTPPAGGDLAGTASALGEFVRAKPGASDFILFTDFVGTRATGFDSVTGMIVDRQGRLAWCERAAKGDAAFDRARMREPMDGCVLITSMLRPTLSLGDPGSTSAARGPIAERMSRASGVPDEAELDRIEARGKAFSAACRTATMTVLPTRINGSFSAESAAAIASQLAGAGCTRATAGIDGPRQERPATMNQMSVMWRLGRTLSEWVKEHPVPSDYVLMADYLIGDRGVMGVQLAICDRSGAIVRVDLQNDHQKAFATLAPRTAADCDRLVATLIEETCGR